MTRRQALLLRAFSVWTVFVFVTLIRNIAKDHTPGHGTGFKVVHYVLALISISLAVAAWRVITKVSHRRGIDVDADAVSGRSS